MTYPIKGLHTHKLYGVWGNVKARCRNERNPSYRWYGARGIDVCDKWYNCSYTFITWCLDNGWKLGLELDRINNDGNYEPGNCRFVTHKENLKNCRKLRSTNKSGVTGIHWNARSNAWHVYDKRKYLGTYKSLTKAKQALEVYYQTVSKPD